MSKSTPIINRFSKNYHEVIQTYCDALNKSKANLFIVMARKGVCFFDILKENGLITLDENQKIVSSSALDFMTYIPSETRVVITDDIMISGTSIADIVNSLLDIGVPECNISIIVLATDSDNMKLNFITKANKNLIHQCWSLSNADCIELSIQISNLLSFLNKPYDVDFPIYNSTTISKETLNKILHPNIWNIYNVTNPYHSESNIVSLTLIPTKNTLSILRNCLGFESTNFAHIKFRLYINNIDSNNISLQLVPYILFYEILYSQVDELYSKLTSNKNLELQYESKLRVCQFILCHRLANFFKELVNCNISFNLNHHAISKLFGYDYEKTIHNLLSNNTNNSIDFSYTQINPDLLDYSKKTNDSILDFPIGYDFHNIPLDDRELNLTFLEPFISWYINRELPIRQELSTGNYHFRKDRNLIKDKTYRLTAGYSFKALSTIFIDKNGLYRWPDVLSVFLDRAIDMGIIVPITFNNTDKQTVCRAFRHGEDLPFGIADKSRVLYFIQQLQLEFSKKKCEGIARISFEKIIVLFIQMALHDKGVFNQFLGFQNREILSIRYSVHGAVATTISPEADLSKLKYYFDAAPYWDWVTEYLVSNGIVTQHKNEKGKPNDYIYPEAFNKYEYQLNNICNEIQVKIKKYAMLFAEWYNAMHRNKRNEFKKQVIQLSTCFSLPTVAIALATELHYFCRYWNEEVEFEFKQYLESHSYNNRLSIIGKDTAKVLNSGKEKYIWFNESAHIKAITDVKKILSRNNSYMSADWEGRWHTIVSSERPYSENLFKKYHECYCYLLICCTCYELLSTGELTNTDATQLRDEQLIKVKAYQKEYKSIKRKYNLKLDNYTELFTFVTSGNFKYKSTKKRIETLRIYMACLVTQFDKTIEDIQNLVAAQPMEASIYFDSCVIIELQCGDERKCSTLIEQAWNELLDNEYKTKTNIFKLKENCDEDGYQRYAIFCENFDTNDPNCYELIKTFLVSLYKKADQNCINNRFIILPQLPPPHHLKYNYKVNMQKEFENFNNSVCGRLTHFFENDTSSQFLIIQKTTDETPNLLDGLNELKTRPNKALNYNILQWQTLADYELLSFVNGRSSFPNGKKDFNPNNSISSLFDYIPNEKEEIISTATIFNYKGKIYALTCNHCLEDTPNKVYLLKTKTHGYHNLYGKRIVDGLNHTTDQSAEYEIAVLKLYWDYGCSLEAYFEDGIMLDLDTSYLHNKTNNFLCFGYPSERGLTINATKYYEANDDYLEFIISEKGSFQSGFSGALFIDENATPVAIAYSYQNNVTTHAYGIPINLATKRAKRIIEEEIERNEI